MKEEVLTEEEYTLEATSIVADDGSSAVSTSSTSQGGGEVKDENWEARWAMKQIASEGKAGYAHIALYNSFLETGKAETGIDVFTHIHTNLMTLQGFMAGFQYLALDTEQDSRRPDNLQVAIFAIRVVGLFLSFFGVLVSLCTVEYLKSMIHEDVELQVMGILRYRNFFLASDQFSVFSTINLLLTVNLMCYGILPAALCIVLNVTSALSMAFGTYMWKQMVLDRQVDGGGRRLYQDPIWQKARDVKKNAVTSWLSDWYYIFRPRLDGLDKKCKGSLSDSTTCRMSITDRGEDLST